MCTNSCSVTSTFFKIYFHISGQLDLFIDDLPLIDNEQLFFYGQFILARRNVHLEIMMGSLWNANINFRKTEYRVICTGNDGLHVDSETCTKVNVF